MSEDVVPVEEYDELSKLVDKLLTEKAQLQLAVEKQADQLKVSVLLLFLFVSFLHMPQLEVFIAAFFLLLKWYLISTLIFI